MARRGANEGSIYQRADGYWTTSISLGEVDGKRRRRVLYGKTRKEVASKLAEALAPSSRASRCRRTG